MTVIELIERASARLEQAGVSFGQGTTNAFDEAAWLVLWRLGLPLDALDDVADEPVDDAKATAVDTLIAQRIDTRKPAAYLTGEAWLQGVPFTVDERAIVPRSLIAEVLNDGTLDAWVQAPPARVLDLCTGTGSLAVLPRCAGRLPPWTRPTSPPMRSISRRPTSNATTSPTASRCTTPTASGLCATATT
jgi:ribosomal protein L3 glutamine methyltransferase